MVVGQYTKSWSLLPHTKYWKTVRYSTDILGGGYTTNDYNRTAEAQKLTTGKTLHDGVNRGTLTESHYRRNLKHFACLKRTLFSVYNPASWNLLKSKIYQLR